MSQQTAVFYTIHVQGQVNPSWSPELFSMEIVAGPNGTSHVTGILEDQAALLGCLVRLVNMGTTLLSIKSEAVATKTHQTNTVNKGEATMTTHPTMTMEAEESKILALLEMMREGWNSGDGTLYAEPFTKEADYTVWNGHYAKGKAAIAAQHQHIFDTFYANTTLHYGEKYIRFLREDVALLRLENANISRENGDLVREYGARPLMVITKEDGQWRIAAFQNTPIIPMQAKE